MLADVLHVPKIKKNLVSIGQMVEQGLQVRFKLDGCFVEDLKNKCRLVAKGKRQGRMFMLDVEIPEVKVSMFANGYGVVADIDIWHKRIGHVNMQRLKLMQIKEIVTGLPTFKVEGMQKICEACQFRRQTRHPFPHDKHVSSHALELVHSDVWGPATTTSMG